ncbi:hypothetical protein B0F90DRAFT_1817189 [Multifurca ochricompacta]|uniref:Telomere-associated protein Rif1 N-terminal domain-containing protein n=1 Tax=Multifurca ochricompacta TaxID=376703 RepID=A0AAD4QNR5_9AGAM|nr:hypothetical protein B0F90DRAFT_1817189 [Multifurca ochricompacta]
MSIPLADDSPLAHPHYFLGPIETIVYSHRALSSGDLSLHDITEAYHTLSTRIRQSSAYLAVGSSSYPALGPLKEKGAGVAAALRRDVLRALRVSAQHISCHTPSQSSGSFEESVGWEQAAPNIKHATDVSTLCHYALRLLSEIFRLPALSSAMSTQDLGFLLEDVTAILCCPQLPSVNGSKTTVLASWAAVGDTPVSVIVVDALNCIVELLTCHGHVFVAHLADLLPSIFPLVMHPSSELRHHTAAVLASFSRTLITYRAAIDKSIIDSICCYTHSFLTPETTRHPTSSRKLFPLLDAAVSSRDFGNAGENAPWALTVVANFTVLLGSSLFLHHGPLKFVMNITQKALKRHPGRDLNPHVWSTFIWSMTQLCAQQGSTSDEDVDIVRRCVLVLKQALHGGLGAALITSLLGAIPAGHRSGSIHRWAISSTIDIVHDMLSSNLENIRDEGYRLLVCLTRESGERDNNASHETEWSADFLLSQFLFDGSLLHADKYLIEEKVGSMRIFSPRCLSQEEILEHWGPISSCFVSMVRIRLKADDTVLASLLMVQSNRFQGNGQAAISPDFGQRLIPLLSQFLPKLSISLSGDAESVEIQLKSLFVSRQLWTVIQNVFSRPSLTAVASSFLAATLQRKFHLSDQELLRNWSLLCSDLIVVGIPNVLESISHQDDESSALEVKKQLWRLVVTHCEPGQGNWRSSTSIHVFPIGSWCMSEDDLDVWERAFERIFSSGAAKAVDLIDEISGQCPAIGPSFPISTAMRIALAIFRRLDLDEEDSIPARTLSFLNKILAASYPPQPSTVKSTSELIKVFHHMIIAIPLSLLESVILAVQMGLVIWIEDKCVSLSEEEYNNLIMSLYDSLLCRLQTLPLSVTLLNALVPLLTAAFSRIPPPALGPAAFQRFFHTVHPRLAVPTTAYSDELRVCLDACVRSYGGEWPPGMAPLSSSSQSQTQLQNEGELLNKALALPRVGYDIGERYTPTRLLEHEVIPDSQCATSSPVVIHASPRARLILEPPHKPVSSISSNAHKISSRVHLRVDLKEAPRTPSHVTGQASPRKLDQQWVAQVLNTSRSRVLAKLTYPINIKGYSAH